jgi:hypothetical protein
MTVILSAGNAFRLAKPTEVYAPTAIQGYQEDNSGNLQIQNLFIKFSYFGKY